MSATSSKPVHTHHWDTLQTPRNIFMARRVRSYNLETRTSRLKLDPRKKPYTAQIAPGIQLAYRRNKGAGVWSVKARFGLKKFAIADDLEDANSESVMTYWQALEKART